MKVQLFFIFFLTLFFSTVLGQPNKIEHKVLEGETIEELAYIYQTETDSIILWNFLVSPKLSKQQIIIIKDYHSLSTPIIELNKLRFQYNFLTTEKVNRETYFNMQLQVLELRKKALDPNVSSSIYESMNISKQKKYLQDSLLVLNTIFDSKIEILSKEISNKESYQVVEQKFKKSEALSIQAKPINLEEIIKTQQASKDSALAYIEKQEKLAFQAEQERVLLEKAMKEKAAKEAAQIEKLEKEKAEKELLFMNSKTNILDTPEVTIKEMTEEEALNAAILKAEQARLKTKNQNNISDEISPEVVKVSSDTKVNSTGSQFFEDTHTKDSLIKNDIKTYPIQEVKVNASKVKSKFKLGDEVSQLRKEKAKFLLTRAKLEIDKNDLKKAMSFIDKSIAMNPSDAEAYHLKGDIWASVEYFDKALESYENAVILLPNSAQIHYNIGNCYIYLGKKDKAFEKMNQAIKLDKQYVLAYSVRAGLLFENQNYKAALADYSTILSINTYFYPALRGRAMCYMNLDNYTEAIQDFKQFLTYDTGDAGVYYHLGLAKMYQEQFYDACLDFLKAKDLGFEPANKAINKYCE